MKRHVGLLLFGFSISTGVTLAQERTPLLERCPPLKVAATSVLDLVMRGEFPVPGPNRLSITIQGESGEFTLTPELAERDGMLIRMPAELRSGDWTITVTDLDTRLSTRIPTIMRVR